MDARRAGSGARAAPDSRPQTSAVALTAARQSVSDASATPSITSGTSRGSGTTARDTSGSSAARLGPASEGAAPSSVRSTPSAASASAISTASAQRPLLSPEIKQYFLPVRSSAPSGSAVVYRPSLIACSKVYFEDAKTGVATEAPASALVDIGSGAVAVDWERAQPVDFVETDLESDPAPGARYLALAPEASRAKSYDAWRKSLVDFVYRTQKLELSRSPSTKAVSKPGETERDFRIRLQHDAREERDRMKEKLRQKYAPKHTALDARIARADQAREREAEQATQSKIQTAISFGTTLLSAFTGRKTLSAATLGKATTAARGVGRAMKDSADVARADDTVESLKKQLADLEAQFDAEVAELEARLDPLTETLETVTLKPKKSNIDVKLCALAWTPMWQASDGRLTAAWD
jgi:hypothetical protein